jgi:hypothetical protein
LLQAHGARLNAVMRAGVAISQDHETTTYIEQYRSN